MKSGTHQKLESAADMSPKIAPAELTHRLINHLSLIYPNENAEELATEIIETFWPHHKRSMLEESAKAPESSLWSEETAIMITYGDSIKRKGEVPLQTLKKFLDLHLKDVFRAVHILPFFPYSSDDGFSVMDYDAVREDLGEWDDIKAIGADYKLMSDMVINHASSRGEWFQGFLAGKEEYKDFFFTADPEQDLSNVTRPRPSPLLTGFDAHDGIKHLWCTFGSDQIDLNFENPKVLIEFVRIMRHYLDENVRIFRLDAIAFLWKQIGTTCIHLPQTHEIIRLFRTLTDFYKDDVLLITETNVPHHENLTYFGNLNEAHLIYNFALPPLLIQALLTGNEYYLKKWMMELPPTREGCAYLNFIASHDGVGLRPATGILLDEDIEEMIRTIRSFGGEISMRSTEDGGERPYEMNIALFDALKGTIYGEDDLQCERFIAAHTIMLGLEGVPAIYVHSMLATPNDIDKFRKSGHKRCINRHRWDADKLEALLEDPQSNQSYVLSELKRLLSIRIEQECFHPNATQFTLLLPEGFVGFWRQSIDRTQSMFCITNLTKEEKILPLHHLNMYSGGKWVDLLMGNEFETREQELVFHAYQSMWITNV